MKHTKGKWRSFTDNANGFGITNGNTVIAIAGETDLKENEANANLIASAPEMLEMLKYTLRYFQDSTNMEGLEMYENLIAKAEVK